MKNETILVTGGAGFIGSSVIEKLLPNNYVVVVDDFNDFYHPLWKQENLEKFQGQKNFIVYKQDIRNFDDMDVVFKRHKFSKILHLAARAGVRPSLKQPMLYADVNVTGTINLLELARKYVVPQFVFGSSSSVYGNRSDVPFSETDPVNSPVSPYATTKKADELFCFTYSHLYNIKMTCLRFFTVYGPKGRPDMAPYLFTKAILTGEKIQKYGEGNSRRDYTYIDDIVDGIMKALENPFDYEIINLGNNKPVTLNEFIALIEKLTGKEAKIHQLSMQPGDVEQTYADISKAKKLLDWEPKTTLEEGLKKFVSWYKAERM